MLLKPPAVIFDWDGTLVNTVPIIYAAVNKTRAAFGLPAEDPATVRHYTAMTKEQSFAVRFGADNATRAIAMYQDFIEEIHAPTFADPVQRAALVMPDAERVLQHLRAHSIPMLVVSNKTSRWLHKEVAYLGWEKYFKVVIGAQDAPVSKPDPQVARLALQQAGIQPAREILFVGDSYADIECANAAGLTSVYFSAHPYSGPSSPQCTIKNYAEFLKLFANE